MKTTAVLPTEFCLEMAMKVGLLIDDNTKLGTMQMYQKQMRKLRQFQQLAISCDFEDCLTPFYSHTGVEITEEQREALEVIHKSTQPWLRGHVVGVMLEKLETFAAGSRDMKDAVEFIAAALGGSGNGQGGQQRHGLLITLTSDGQEYGS